jgi:glycogen debranching enzyme
MSSTARAIVRPETLSAWNGPSLLIVSPNGECGGGEPLTGYYFREARFLSTLRFTVDDEPLWLCETAIVSPSALAFTYVYPEITEFGGGGSGSSGDEVPVNGRGIPQRALAIAVTCSVVPDGLAIAVHITNHAKTPVRCELAFACGADFADIQEALGGRRELEAPVHCEPTALGAVFRYEHERLHYVSTVHLTTHREWRVTDSRIAATIALESLESVDLGLRVDPSERDGAPLDIDGDARARAVDAWTARFTSVSIPGNRVAETIIADNVRDFASFPLLEGPPDEWLALQAGMPLYPALFARDTLTAGWQAAWIDQGTSLDASLTKLARLQSARTDDWHDEEPGRIPYQVRRGPLALLDINPYAAYFADYASPLMFVISLGHLYSWTGDAGVIRRHWDAAHRILEWARTLGDQDGDGYLEYHTRSSKGTKNRGWKDSGDAIIYPDGTPVPPPLGTCELQGYWYAAQQLMAVMGMVIGKRTEARSYWRSAKALKQRFNRDWWMDDESCVALAMDAKKHPVPGVSSNIGHCIATGIVSTQHLPAAVGRLFAPDMFSGWGIRTLSASHAAYSPMSYHCGSVWPVEQATMVFGLRRFGFDARALELTRAQFDLAQLYPGHRIPETIGGFARRDRPTPGAYPRANAPQLWNATAFPLLVHSILGLQPVAPLRLLVVSPALPDCLPEVVLRDLRLGDAIATLRFWRDEAGRSHAEVLQSRGTFRLLHQPPPESLTATARRRLGALVDTIRH